MWKTGFGSGEAVASGTLGAPCISPRDPLSALACAGGFHSYSQVYVERLLVGCVHRKLQARCPVPQKQGPWDTERADLHEHVDCRL